MTRWSDESHYEAVRDTSALLFVAIVIPMNVWIQVRKRKSLLDSRLMYTFENVSILLVLPAAALYFLHRFTLAVEYDLTYVREDILNISMLIAFGATLAGFLAQVTIAIREGDAYEFE
jgi:hypothetical protein